MSSPQMAGRSEAALGLREEAQEPFLRWALGLPYVVLRRDSVLIERGGDAAAFGGVMRDPAAAGSSLDWFGVVDPGHLGRLLGGWLVTWALGVVAAREPGEGPFDGPHERAGRRRGRASTPRVAWPRARPHDVDDAPRPRGGDRRRAA